MILRKIYRAKTSKSFFFISLQRALSCKTKKLKALAAELKVNQIDEKSTELYQQKLFNEIRGLRQELLNQVTIIRPRYSAMT